MSFPLSPTTSHNLVVGRLALLQKIGVYFDLLDVGFDKYTFSICQTLRHLNAQTLTILCTARRLEWN